MQKLFRYLTILSAIWLLTPLFAARAGEHVVLQLKWYHQFQFAGYYAALEQGYYRDADLEVEIRQGGVGVNYIEKVSNGEADFGTAGVEVLLKRLAGGHQVVLAAIFQHSPAVIMAKRSSGIYSPHDLIGKRVMIAPSSEADLWAMLRREGVTRQNIELAETTWDIEELIDDRIDATVAYITNTPFFMKQKGIPITLIRPRTYGVDFYGDCLFSDEKYIHDHHETVRGFVDASLKGWQYAMERPDEIIDLILKKYNPKKTREHLVYEAGAMRELILPRLVQIGHINPGRWVHIADTYVALGMTPPNYSLEGFTFDPREFHLHPLFRWLLIIIGATLLVAVIGGLWLIQFNRSLRKAVESRTAQLQELNVELQNEVVERRETETALRKSEEFLAEAQEIARLGSWEWDIQNDRIHWSDQVYSLFGLDPHSFDPGFESGMQYAHPDDRQLIADTFGEILEQGGKREFEHRILRPDKSIRYVQSQIALTRAEDGAPLRLSGTTQDITARKMAEEALRYSEERYRRLIENFPNGAVVMLDREMRFTFAGGLGLADVGLSKEALEGNYVHEVFDEQTLSEVVPQCRDALDGQGSVREIPFADRIFEVRALPITGEQGDILAAMAITQDITHRKQSERALELHRDELEKSVRQRTVELEESNRRLTLQMEERRRVDQALRESEARHRALFETMAQGVVYQDEDGLIISTNPSAGTILGRDQKEMAGRDLAEVLTRTLRENKTALPKEEFPSTTALQTGRVVRDLVLGVFNPRSEEYRWVKMTSMPLFHPGDKRPYRVYSTFEDITELKRSQEEEALARMQSEVYAEELKQTLERSEAQRIEVEKAKETAERMAVKAEAANRAKSDFLANVSHELRTPLNPIMGLAEVLLETELNDDQAQHLNDILLAARRLLTMVNDLIELSRLDSRQAGEHDQPFNLESSLASLLREAFPNAESKGLALTGALAPDVPRLIEGDAWLLRLTLLKLVDNAVRFTEKGRIGITVETEGDPDEIGGNTVLHFTVSDTGIGIPADRLEGLFQDFTQVDGSKTRVHGGLGLGLTMARRFVDHVGGRLWAESEAGQGAAFHFTWPYTVLDESVK